LPHEAETLIALISKVLEETPRSPRDVQADVPPALSDIIMRTLSKDRDKRPKSASELHDWLERV
jgi:eukaryotic-like serine/threonine-protein kinase